MDDKRLDRLEEKIDTLVEKAHSIDKTLARNTDSLEVHIKRSDSLEEQIKPLKDHIVFLNSIIKIGSFIAFSLGVIYTFLKILAMLGLT